MNGHDLAEFDPGIVRAFLADRFLVQTRNITDTDGEVLIPGPRGMMAANVDDSGGVTDFDVRSVETYEVGLQAICARLRRNLSLEGPPVRRLVSGVTYLGALPTEHRRRDFYLARGLRGMAALQPLLTVSSDAGFDGAVVVLTPTRRDLPNEVTKRLEAERLTIRAVSDLLDDTSLEPFKLLGLNDPRRLHGRSSVRLFIDGGGRTAILDGKALRLTPREFAALQALAVEAYEFHGNVPRDRLVGIVARAVKYDDAPNAEQVTVVVSRLRKELVRVSTEGDSGQHLIRTIRGFGYGLNLAREDISVI